MIKKLICAAALLMVAGLQHTRAQYVYGTTGLLHAPSADMQRDKTFLCGFSYLQVAATPKHWNYDTWNYYINITLFPWLEVGYTCTLHKIGLPQYGYSYKFRNQDRQFSARHIVGGRIVRPHHYLRCPLLPPSLLPYTQPGGKLAVLIAELILVVWWN